MRANNNFHFLRWLFASMVVFAHLSVLPPIEAYQYLYSVFSSHFAITGFFVISGFLVSDSLKRSESLKVYYTKRIRRIFPAYYAVIVLFSVLLFFVSSRDIAQYFWNKDFWSYVLWNGLFLNFLAPNLPGVFDENPVTAVNGSLWTLKIELGFYLILPVWMYVLRRIGDKGKIILLSAIYLLSITYRYLFSDVLQLPEISRQLPAFLSYFSVGIFFHLYLDYSISQLNRWIVPAMLILLTEYYLLEIEVLKPLCWGIVVMYIAFKIPKLKFFPSRDDYSYGIYLCHFPIIQLFVLMGWFERFNPLIGGFILYAVVVCFAFLLWHTIEKRFLIRRN